MPKESFKRVYDQFKNSGLNRNATCLQLTFIFKVPLESASRRIDVVCLE